MEAERQIILHLCPYLAVDTEECHVSILKERYAHVGNDSGILLQFTKVNN